MRQVNNETQQAACDIHLYLKDRHSNLTKRILSLYRIPVHTIVMVFEIGFIHPVVLSDICNSFTFQIYLKMQLSCIFTKVAILLMLIFVPTSLQVNEHMEKQLLWQSYQELDFFFAIPCFHSVAQLNPHTCTNTKSLLTPCK